jgi:hypothetical protein
MADQEGKVLSFVGHVAQALAHSVSVPRHEPVSRRSVADCAIWHHISVNMMQYDNHHVSVNTLRIGGT